MFDPADDYLRDIFTNDIELFGLIAGLRRVAKKEGPDAEALMQIAPALSAAGFFVARNRLTGCAYASADAGAVEKLLELENGEFGGGNPEKRREIIREIGIMLGYPECCATAFAGHRMQDDAFVMARFVENETAFAKPVTGSPSGAEPFRNAAAAPETADRRAVDEPVAKPQFMALTPRNGPTSADSQPNVRPAAFPVVINLPWQLNFLPPMVGPVFYYPCSARCESSRMLADRYIESLERFRPGFGAYLKFRLARPVLVSGTGRWDFVVFGGTADAENGILYREFHKAGDFHSVPPPTPAFAAFVSNLPPSGLISFENGVIHAWNADSIKPAASLETASGTLVLNYF